MGVIRFRVILALSILLTISAVVNGYGFRYRYNPSTQDTQLWTHLPGSSSPMVYDNNHLVQGPVTSIEFPGLYKFYSVDGRLRWKCKIGAYYSEFFQKCIWQPGHYFAKGG